MLRTIVRFIVSALVLMVTSFLVPGFTVSGFTTALLAAVVIAILGYVVESLMGNQVTPQRRGFIGFITAAVVIYLTQYILPGVHASILGALLAALVIGLIDSIIPTTLR